MTPMSNVSIRDLRNHGGDIVERAFRGERIVITRSGKAVAELHPLRHHGTDAATLLDRWRNVPCVDPAALRRDLDEVIDPTL